MLVRMLQTGRGSPDGIRLLTYEAGREYELPPDLARVFVEELRWAEPAVRGGEKPAPSMDKMAAGPSANKDAETDPTIALVEPSRRRAKPAAATAVSKTPAKRGK